MSLKRFGYGSDDRDTDYVMQQMAANDKDPAQLRRLIKEFEGMVREGHREYQAQVDLFRAKLAKLEAR